MSRYLLFAMSPGGGEKRLLKGRNYLGKRNDSRGNVAVNIAERKKKGNIFIRFFPRPLFLGDAIMSRAGKLCMHSGKGRGGQFGKEKIAFSAVGALREKGGGEDISLTSREEGHCIPPCVLLLAECRNSRTIRICRAGQKKSFPHPSLRIRRNRILCRKLFFA